MDFVDDRQEVDLFRTHEISIFLHLLPKCYNWKVTYHKQNHFSLSLIIFLFFFNNLFYGLKIVSRLYFLAVLIF